MESSPSGSDDFVFPQNRILILPENLRDELKVLLESLTPPEFIPEAVEGALKIVTVGDMVTLTLFKTGIEPNICIVDFKTKRCGVDADTKKEVSSIGTSYTKVKNPAATITGDMWKAVLEAYKSTERTRIEVDGEEDLAALVCLSVAPEGTVVIYGIPDMGVEVVHTNERTKTWANNILKRMAVV
jgi:uncharacterized protein (UPF0218 family)